MDLFIVDLLVDLSLSGGFLLHLFLHVCNKYMEPSCEQGSRESFIHCKIFLQPYPLVPTLIPSVNVQREFRFRDGETAIIDCPIPPGNHVAELLRTVAERRGKPDGFLLIFVRDQHPENDPLQ